jgi:hypothetical protein
VAERVGASHACDSIAAALFNDVGGCVARLDNVTEILSGDNLRMAASEYATAKKSKSKTADQLRQEFYGDVRHNVRPCHSVFTQLQ